MITIELRNLIEHVEEGELQKLLSLFCCTDNHDVEHFLRKQAISSEGRFTRTTLIIDDQNDNEIAGYFSILIKVFEFQEQVSKSARQSIQGNKEATAFAGILIAQLGRSDSYKGKLKGNMIMDYVLAVCEQINHLTAGRIICIEYDHVQALNVFYERQGFRTIQQSGDSLKSLSYLKMAV